MKALKIFITTMAAATLVAVGAPISDAKDAGIDYNYSEVLVQKQSKS
ncbi:MAG: hypothetical protein LBM27_00510 [Lactobacillaceae bacterium]|jgi:hypothetical protein|nr:hypothetical protein [Lactobacillaceae bacterium]